MKIDSPSIVNKIEIIGISSTPSTPSSGNSVIYHDSSSDNLYNIDDNGNKFHLQNSKNGWISLGIQPTYSTAVSVVFTGMDIQSYFPVGTRVRLTQTTWKYFYVNATDYSGGTTYVGLVAGSSDTVANATIYDFNYAHGQAGGFPNAFSWTPSWTGLTITGSPTYSATFSMSGKEVLWTVTITPNGGTTASTAGTTYVTGFPVVPAIETSFLMTQIANVAVYGIGNLWTTSNGRGYTPAWSSNNGYIALNGTYRVT